MGSETSKHKLVTLDQVANVPPTLKQQTLIKGLLLAWFFTWSKHPIEWRKLTLEWRKTKPYSKKNASTWIHQCTVACHVQHPSHICQTLWMHEYKIEQSYPYQFGSSQTLVCGSSDAWKKKKEKKKRLQRQSHEECSQRDGRVPGQKKKESLKSRKRQKNSLQTYFFCFSCF